MYVSHDPTVEKPGSALSTMRSISAGVDVGDGVEVCEGTSEGVHVAEGVEEDDDVDDATGVAEAGSVGVDDGVFV